MMTLKFADTYNMVAFLAKPVESEGFEHIVYFLNAHTIKYALTVNPTIYTSCIEQFWATIKAKIVNGEVQLQALVDGKKIIITESIVRRDLQLEDAESVDCLPNATIFEQLTLTGHEKLSLKLTFYKNLDNVGKLLMYPRFVRVFVNQQLEGMPTHERIYIAPSHTKKIFGNIRRVGKGFSGRETPLFQTMVVQAQAGMGEGSINPIDPHHTPTIIQPSTSQPQKKQRSRRSKRKDTQVPQSSVPSDNVADEVINEEMDDSLVRATTTASSLEAKQDSGNINNTRSKATLNEPSSPRTSSGSGPRCQETIGDTITQTRFENVSKLSNDPLLARGNTLQSGEDRLKLKELMELCINLQQRVLDLETTKTTQATEIASLKRRVKKLERRNKSRTHRIKRPYRVGSSRRVESSKDEGLGEEDASKQGRIADIDANEDIYLVNVLTGEDMFGVNDLEGDAVLDASEGVVETAKERINVVEEVDDIIDAAKSVSAIKENIITAKETVSAAATTVSAASEIPIVTTADELTLAQALAELKSSRPPTQGISFREPSEATTTTTTTTIIAAPKPPQDKGKGIMIEEPMVEKDKPMKKQEHMRIDEELTFKLQAEEEEEERLAREKAQQVEEANTAWDDIQVKTDADYQLAQRLQAQEQDELTDEEKARLFVQFLEQRRKHFAAKRAEEKRNRPPTRAQQRSIMCTYLKNMEGWKPKNLNNKSFVNIQELFDKAINKVNTFIDYRTKLVEESSKKAEAEIAHESSLKRAGEELEQESSKKQKLEEDKESEELKKCLEIVPDDGGDVTIDATPLSTKSPTIMLKNFDIEDLEVLWSIVKSRFKKTEPVNYMDNFLLLNLKTIFEHHVEDNVWKNQQGLVRVLNWKLYDSCEVHCATMQNILFYLLVEKIYPLTNHTLHQMFNDVKFQVDYECEMAFELLRLVKKQLKEGYVPE
ncbi:hypothetical protein Tco_0609521 [Tanacetum coccineum]